MELYTECDLLLKAIFQKLNRRDDDPFLEQVINLIKAMVPFLSNQQIHNNILIEVHNLFSRPLSAFSSLVFSELESSMKEELKKREERK